MGITRGEILDRLTLFAIESEANWERVMNDAKGVIEEQIGIALPSDFVINMQVDTPNSMNFSLPHIPKEGAPLSDEDLETVAGGFLDTEVKTCIVLSTGASAVVI